MIVELIQDAADFLSANPYFSNVPVVSVNEKDITNIVDQHLAKVGIGVILGTPGLKDPISDAGAGGRGVNFQNIDFRATVFELVTRNRGGGGTSKWAPTVAETISVLLHLYKPQNIAEALVCVQGPTLVPNLELLVYDVAFRTSGGVSMATPITKIATPTLSIVDNGATKTITLACSTPYAQMFYSTDGSFPSPLDSTNTPRAPYTAPFTVPNGTKVQVRGWLAGYLASDVVRQNV